MGAVGRKESSDEYSALVIMNEGERKGGLTLLLCDGEGEEGDEGGHGQDGEEHADHDKELQPLEPGAPVVLQVHDVCDESPDGQNSCQDTNTHGNDINHWGSCWVLTSLSYDLARSIGLNRSFIAIKS